MVGQAVHAISALAVLSAVLANMEHRQLSYTKIAGYEPGSDVTEHNKIDLDQKEVEAYLGQKPPDYTGASAIYNNGAHSGAYARLTLSPLPKALAKGATASQVDNSAATGYIKTEKGSGVTEVDVTYTSTCIENEKSVDRSTAGCYKASGDILIDGTVNIGTPTTVANKYRTLAGFSTKAGTKMGGQTTFEKFNTYYGYADYAHKYVTAALEGSGIFSGKDHDARVQGVKKGSAYMNVWMYVIREMEDAEDDCQAGCIACNDDPVHAWDEAVAFYTGTLEGTDLTPGGGKMLYALADKRCKNFGTCDGWDASGVSEVNKAIFEQFALGRAKLQEGKCSEIPPIKDTIIKHMTIPLIQGSLRYAYKVDKLQGASKEKAEGAVFAAAVLPMVHACSSTAAATISKNMKIDSAAPMADGFAAVKDAFESTYPCLGISCKQVGGLLLTSDYYEGAAPCGLVEETSQAYMVSGLVSIVAAILTLQF